MGRASALLLAEEGAKVVCADVSGHEESAAAEIGKDAIAVRADVSRAADVQAMFAAATETFGRLDVVFNNAGFNAPHHPLDETDDDLFDRLVAVNLRGVFLGIKYAIPALRASGGGSIISTASATGLVGRKGIAAYGGTKGALAAMTRSWAAEYSPAGVRVNTVASGPVYTNIQPPETTDAVGATTIMARAAQPEEIANVIVFLASAKASYITGAVIAADGGRMAI